MKKTVLLIWLTLAVSLLNLLPVCAQVTQHKGIVVAKTTEIKKVFPYWYVGAGYSVPLMFGDVYSLTEPKKHFGSRFDLKLGYRFSNIFGLEFGASIGKMKASSRNFSKDFILGNDGMTYYPYTLVDGQEYSVYPDLFGFWDKNSENAHLTGVKYSDIYAKVCYMQFALQGVFNLNRMFMEVPTDKEQFLSVLVKPGIYLQKFSSQAYAKANDKEIAPKVKTSPSIGLGGDIALHFRLTRQLGLELSSGLVWVNNQNFDGIRTMKRSKDDYIWSSGATIIWKFGRKTELKPKLTSVDIAPIPMQEEKNESAIFRTFAFSFLTPDITTRKERSFSDEAMLYFPVSKWDIIPSLNYNQVELDKIAVAFSKLKSDEDLTMERISVTGYASPEGDEAFNKVLSYNRAKAVGDYISSLYRFPTNQIDIIGKGEDWEGLQKSVERWAYPNKEQIVLVLDQNIAVGQKKAKLKLLGETYYKMSATLYPALRRNEYTFHYSVKPYEVADAVKIIQVSPEKLSAEEMISVANQYPMGDANFETTVDVAFKFYPAHPLVNIYKALVELLRDNAPAAQTYLDRVSSDSRAWNLMGVMYAKLGNRQLSEQYFQKAIDNGDKNAVQNMNNFASNRYSK